MSKEEEAWKDAKYYSYNGEIIDLSHRYQVSDRGRVWSKRYGRLISVGRASSSNYGDDNYRVINPSFEVVDDNEERRRKKRRRKLRIGRLVLSSFCERDDACSLEVDHINSNITDDRLENLEWVTREENQRRRYARSAEDNFVGEIVIIGG